MTVFTIAKNVVTNEEVTMGIFDSIDEMFCALENGIEFDEGDNPEEWEMYYTCSDENHEECHYLNINEFVDDEEDCYTYEVGFDPYLGCYTYDC